MIQQANANGGKSRISGKSAGGKNGGNGRGGNGNGHKGNGSNGNGHHKSTRPNYAAITLLVLDWQRKRDEAKRLYSEADAVEQKIIDRLGIGNSFQMKGTGQTVVVNDNFRDAAGNLKTVAFKPCGVKAVEVKLRGSVRTVNEATDVDDDE